MNILPVTNSNNIYRQYNYTILSFEGRVSKSLETTLTEETFKIASASIASVASFYFIITSKLTKEQQLEVIELFKNGMSYKELAQKYKCRESIISRIISRQSFVKELIALNKANSTTEESEQKVYHNRSSLPSQEQIDEIIKLFSEGFSMSTIAEKYNTTKNIVWKIINIQQNADDLKTKNRLMKKNQRDLVYNLSEEEYKKITELYKEGMEVCELAALIHCPTKTIKAVLNSQDNFKELKAEHKKNKSLQKIYHSPKIEEDILDMYKNGISILIISEFLNIPYNETKNVIYKHDNKKLKEIYWRNRSQEKKEFSLSEEEEIINLFQNGAPIGTIAKQFDCNYNSIICLIQNNEKFKEIITGNRLKKEEHNIPQSLQEEIIKLYSGGLSKKDIAKQLNCDLYSVCYIILNNPELKKTRVVSMNESCSEEEKTAMINMYVNGHSKQEIAKKFNYSVASIYNFFNSLDNIEELKIKNKEKQRKYTPQQIEEMVSLYNEGLTLSQIAAKFSCCKATVYKYLSLYADKKEIIQNESVEKRKERKRQITKEKKLKAVELHKKGYTIVQISEELGISDNSTIIILKKHNSYNY